MRVDNLVRAALGHILQCVQVRIPTENYLPLFPNFSANDIPPLTCCIPQLEKKRTGMTYRYRSIRAPFVFKLKVSRCTAFAHLTWKLVRYATGPTDPASGHSYRQQQQRRALMPRFVIGSHQRLQTGGPRLDLLRPPPSYTQALFDWWKFQYLLNIIGAT
jgi:hypothetical protein